MHVPIVLFAERKRITRQKGRQREGESERGGEGKRERGRKEGEGEEGKDGNGKKSTESDNKEKNAADQKPTSFISPKFFFTPLFSISRIARLFSHAEPFSKELQV